MTLQTYYNVQFLFARDLGIVQHFFDADGVSGHGFFHEHMFSLLHCLFKMKGAEARRRCEDNYVGEWNCFQVAVKSHELVLLGHSDFVFDISGDTRGIRKIILRECFVAFVHPVAEYARGTVYNLFEGFMVDHLLP